MPTGSILKSVSVTTCRAALALASAMAAAQQAAAPCAPCAAFEDASREQLRSMFPATDPRGTK